MALTDSNALCTLAEVKEALGIAPGDVTKDTALERRIKAASARIETYCNRKFRYVAGNVERVAGGGTPYIFPSRFPVYGTPVVAIGDPLGSSTSPIPSGEVVVDGQMLRWNGGTFPVMGYRNPGITGDMATGMNRANVLMTYDGGYWLPNDSGTKPAGVEDLPADLQEAACALAVEMQARVGSAGNVIAESVGGASIQLSDPSTSSGMSGYVESLLAPYVRFV